MDTDRVMAIRHLVLRAGRYQWAEQVECLQLLGLTYDEIRQALPPEAWDPPQMSRVRQAQEAR